MPRLQTSRFTDTGLPDPDTAIKPGTQWWLHHIKSIHNLIPSNYERHNLCRLRYPEGWRGQVHPDRSYLRYVEGVEVAVIDCDNTQHSMNVYREHDLLVTNENPRLKRIMHKFYLTHKIKPYQILMTSPGDAVKVAEDFVKAGNNPKVVFFDITGTINNRDIVNLIAKMHYIFVPITTETGEMASSISFANNVYNRMITTGQSSIREMRLVWNKVNSRDKPRLCEIIDNYMEKLGLSSLDTVLVKSNKFEKDGMETGNGAIFRSTMLPPDKRLLKGSNLEELVKEIRSIIQV